MSRPPTFRATADIRVSQQGYVVRWIGLDPFPFLPPSLPKAKVPPIADHRRGAQGQALAQDRHRSRLQLRDDTGAKVADLDDAAAHSQPTAPTTATGSMSSTSIPPRSPLGAGWKTLPLLTSTKCPMKHTTSSTVSISLWLFPIPRVSTPLPMSYNLGAS
jgi:hypothetical protein